VLIRDAEPEQMPAVGELRVTAYRAGKHLSENSEYEPRLRGLGDDGKGEVLVAVSSGEITGTVMLQQWPDGGQLVTGPGEAEIRALAVAPSSQGSGVGSALLKAVIDRARERGVTHLLLFTQPEMRAAQRLYEREGFTRLPERDWVMTPQYRLLAYGLRLADGG
jgi:ribosomal protein S18 acetylase RimI-like enzyme